MYRRAAAALIAEAGEFLTAEDTDTSDAGQEDVEAVRAADPAAAVDPVAAHHHVAEAHYVTDAGGESDAHIGQDADLNLATVMTVDGQ